MYSYKDELFEQEEGKNIYNFTITVKPYKSFYKTDKKKTIYKYANDYEQYVFVVNHLRKLTMFKRNEYTLVSEKHENGNLHYHGMIYLTDFESILLNSSLNNFFGKSEVKSFETSVDLIKWNKYIHKGFEMSEETKFWNKLYKSYKLKMINTEEEKVKQSIQHSVQ